MDSSVVGVTTREPEEMDRMKNESNTWAADAAALIDFAPIELEEPWSDTAVDTYGSSLERERFGRTAAADAYEDLYEIAADAFGDDESDWD